MPPAPQESHLRRDVQGLRAVAVLLVAIAHARLGFLPGGFVGVDVFFVISGFLITGLLVREAQRDGRVSLTGFYARRARRILPAASLVLLVTVGAGVLLLPALEGRDLVRDALWATFFAANVKFAHDGTDYFSSADPPSAVQHFWSLAVEEQFYLVWPALVLVAVLLARRTRRTSARESLGVVLGLIATASLVWSVLDTPEHATQAYFSTFTRAWELALGGLVACLAPELARLGAHVRAAASWAGLAAVGAAAVLYSEATPFPGYAALLPVVGTAALLGCGVGAARWGPQALLGLAPLRVVGDWSYSFYLWHWPALILGGQAFGWGWGWRGGVVLVGALALSGLTYALVEQPFRRARVVTRSHRRGLVLYPLAVAVSIPALMGASAIVTAATTYDGDAITLSNFGAQPGEPAPDFDSDRQVALVQASVLAAIHHMEIPAGLTPNPLDIENEKPDVGACVYAFPANRGKLCPQGDTDAERTLVLLGDSHARQWAPALDRIAQRLGYRAYYLVMPGCPGAGLTPWRSNGSDEPDYVCGEFQDWAMQQVADLRPDVTIIGSDVNDQGYEGPDGEHVTGRGRVLQMFRDAIEERVTEARRWSGRVVFIGDPPQVKVDAPDCLTEQDADLGTCLARPDQRHNAFITAAREGAEAAGADYLDTKQWFCWQERCPSVVGEYVTRRDYAHVTVAYALELTDELDRALALAG